MPSPFLSRAKTMRASEDARREGAPAFEPKVSRFTPAHRRYTPELIASGRVRYEQTTESVAAIAADFDVLPGSFRRMARKLKWVRHGAQRRALPMATLLHAQAEALENELAPPPVVKEPSPPLSPIDRIERAVLAELSTVEAMRARLGALPKRGRDAERTARTLSTLTETLNKLQRMRCVTEGQGSGNGNAAGSGQAEGPERDEGPKDIHVFRLELARRIAALSADHQETQAAQNDALQNALWPD
jgi:hypothetical protein